jgi:hypothetical protein
LRDAVFIEPEGERFRIGRAAVVLRDHVSGLYQTAFARMVNVSGNGCPAFRVLDAGITVDAKLIST